LEGVSQVQIPSRYGGLEIRVVDFKDPERVRARAEKKYSATIRQPGPGIPLVYDDVVRASAICTSLQQTVDVVEWLHETVYIVSAKNRFHSPTSHRFRFFMFKIRIPSDGDFDHIICEVQVHHAAIKELDEAIGSHEHYEYFCVLYAGSDDTVSDRLDDLSQILHGSDRLNDQFVVDVQRLQMLAFLSSKKG
jgi:hypothetical protein